MKTYSCVMTFCVMIFYVFLCNAQDIERLMPYEIREAYQNGTRSYDGKPGSQYWQNTADYQIKVKVDSAQNKLHGSEQVTYYNNSPDDLNQIVLNLYYDVHKKGNTRISPVNTLDTEEEVKISSLSINGKAMDLDDERTAVREGTKLTIKLKETLRSGGSLQLEVNWAQPVPISDGRTRFFGDANYMIAYFYPQIAVYDDIFGWNLLDYNLGVEFYHELSNYDVEIEFPPNYYVLATGDLVNSAEVLPPSVLERYNAARNASEIVSIIDTAILAEGFKAQGKWHYKAEQVPDFAITASKSYLWDGMMAETSADQVFVHNLYPADGQAYYQPIIHSAKAAIEQLSSRFPAIDYPYSSLVSFHAQFWMEYPMIANNAWPSDYETLHETIHTYFPFYVRTNERRWAWMDEGWAEYLSSYVQIIDFKSNGMKADFIPFQGQAQLFEGEHYFDGVFVPFTGKAQMYTGSTIDMPLMVPSISQITDSYNFQSYGLAATALGLLHHQLGDEVFLKCTQQYINDWKLKSPTPYDFFYTFERVSGRELDWLFRPWYFEFGSPDLAIKSLEDGKLTIENKGNRPVSVFVHLYYDNGEFVLLDRKPDVWKNGNSTLELDVPNPESIDKIYVNRRLIDCCVEDNYYPKIADRYVNVEIPEEIAGYYESSALPMVMKVWKEDDYLYLKVRELDKPLALYPTSSLSYHTLDDYISLHFFPGQQNGEVELKIKFLDNEFTFTRNGGEKVYKH